MASLPAFYANVATVRIFFFKKMIATHIPKDNQKFREAQYWRFISKWENLQGGGREVTSTRMADL